jgi:hypothetical protein
MSVPHLSVVRVDDSTETPATRATRLFAEAQGAALEQVHALESALALVASLAGEIAEGGDVYPAGVRDLCRRMAEEISLRAQTLDALAVRTLDFRGH